MIFEVLRIGLRRLWHGKLELVLVFVVPVVFFTIFALIFDKQLGGGKAKPVRVTAADLDGAEASGRLIDQIAADDLVLFKPLDGRHGADAPYEALDRVRKMVIDEEATVALVVMEGWAESLSRGDPLAVQMLVDTSDAMAPAVIEGLVQRKVAEAMAEAAAGARGPNAEGESPLVEDELALAANEVVARIDLFSEGKASPVVSMYAAGIAVMFLLFSATGHSGSLLEEQENQTLERLMTSRLGMTQLILGKWLFLSLLGVAQIVVMFAWAQAVFGVDVLARAPGFLLMTFVTAACASSLALVLAAACRSRAQLSAVSVVLILTMSALGGSMVPRYLMSDAMQQAGKLTFNAWAIDGYNKLFWRDLPLARLAPELLVLGGSALVLLLVARLLAMRWETA